MANDKNNAGASTAIQPAKTIDDVVALLKVNERTEVGKEGHEQPDFQQAVPWIGYRSNKSKSRVDELNAAGVVENAFYLYGAAGVVAPKPFYIHLVASYHFYSLTDDDNNILEVSPVLNQELRKRKFSDHLYGLALVRLPGATPMFRAATFSQRSAMTRAFDAIRSILASFEKDKEGREWKANGAAHTTAFTLAKWPTFAVRAKIWGKLQPPSQPGGREYNLGLSSIEPTPADDVKALNRYMGFEPESYGGENKKSTEFAAAMRSFGMRRAEVVDLLAKQEKNAAKK